MIDAKLKKWKKRKPDPRGYGITISAYISPETYKKLVDAAMRQDRTISKIVEICIEGHLPKIR